MTVVLVVLGGAVGAVVRLGLRRLNGAWPLGTLVANVVGSFLLGVVVAAVEDPVVRTALGAGVLGGLTTFSTLTVEVAAGPRSRGVAYVSLSVVLGVAAALAGLAVGGGPPA